MSAHPETVNPAPGADEAYPDWRILDIAGRPVYKWERERGVTCVVCPGCAFTFDECHTDDATGDYSCPLCGAVGR